MFPTHRLEADWIAAFQGGGELKRVMIWCSYLGSEALVCLLPFVYFCLSRKAGARLALFFPFCGSFSHIFKLAFHLPRPYWIDARIMPLSTSGSYGMPSGHVLSASIVWPFVAGTLGKFWAWGMAIAVVVLVSVSRVYLGAHFISDVAGAWVIGTGLFLGFRRLERLLIPWVSGLHPFWQLTNSLAAAGVLALIGLGVRLAIDGIPDDPSWSHFSVNARNLSGLFFSSGEFLGAAFGIMMAERWARFEVSGAWWKRGVALGWALLGAWLIRRFRTLIPAQTETLQSLLYLTGGIMLSCWMLFVAPWILLKAGLLRASNPPKVE